MLLLRTLFAMFVLAMTSAAASVVDIKFDPSLFRKMPPLPDGGTVTLSLTSPTFLSLLHISQI